MATTTTTAAARTTWKATVVRGTCSVRSVTTATTSRAGNARFGGSSSSSKDSDASHDVLPSTAHDYRAPSSSSSSSSVLLQRDVRATLTQPDSAFAYRYLLQHGHFTSLLELAHAPYAPAPLQVLQDCMQYVHTLQEQQQQQQNNDDNNVTAVVAHASVTAAAMTPVACGDVLAQMTCALSCVRAVRVLLQRARDAVAHAVDAVDEVGDRQSVCALQQHRDGFVAFARYLDAYRRRSSSGGSDGDTTTAATTALAVCADDDAQAALPRWRLPDVVYATMLRGLLAMAQLLGHHLAAVDLLDALLQLTATCHRDAHTATTTTTTTTTDNALATTTNDTAALYSNNNDDDDDARVRPVCANEHVCAMQSCTRAGAFDVAAGLYRRLLHLSATGALHVSVTHVTHALIALAQCCRRAADWHTLRDALTRSEAAAVVPVSERLYTALIAAVGRARDLSAPLPIALALYRRLRDGGIDNNGNDNNNNSSVAAPLRPSVHTYDALLSCCAAAAEPMRAFALYHEARAQCGVDAFPASLYAHLLRAYSAAGYGADARTMLDVLAEAGASLTRAAFHAVLAGAVTLRDAQEVLQVMLSRYHIAATPHTYAYLLAAAVRDATTTTTTTVGTPRRGVARPRSRGGSSLLLQLHDIHEAALAALLAQTSDASSNSSHADDDNAAAAMTPSHRHAPTRVRALEQTLRTHYPRYVRTLEHALLRVRLDAAHADAAALAVYVKPLLRVVQQRMNAFAGMPPQAPTRLPLAPAAVQQRQQTQAQAQQAQQQQTLCVAVLAADVLADVDAYVRPFVQHYSAVIVPYSSLAALQRGRARDGDDNDNNNGSVASHENDNDDDDDDDTDGNAAWAHDTWRTHNNNNNADDGASEWCGDAQAPTRRERRRRLVQFLREHRDVVHVMSLEEEMRASASLCRYGVSVANAYARCAGLAVHLARRSSLRRSADNDNNDNNNNNNNNNNDDDSHDSCGAGEGSDSVYARHGAHVVLMSTHFAACGRIIVDLKRHYNGKHTHAHAHNVTPASRHHRQRRRYIDSRTSTLATLRDALSRVHYHDPATQPHWTPPSLTIATLVASTRAHNNNDDDSSVSRVVQPQQQQRRHCLRQRGGAAAMTASGVVSSEDAEQLYKRALGMSHGDAHDNNNRNSRRYPRTAPVTSTTTTARDVDMDASMLSAMLAE